MTKSSIQLLSCVIMGLLLAQVSAAQPVTGLSDLEVRKIRNDIYKYEQLIEQKRRAGQPIPAELRSAIVSQFYPYSPTLTKNELALASAMLASIGRLSHDKPLAPDLVDDVIGWMIAKAWGEEALLRSSRDSNLDSVQFERLVDGVLTRQEPVDYTRTRTIERLIEEGELSPADFDLLGERLQTAADDSHRRVVTRWLLRANSAGKLDQSPTAARALLFNAGRINSAHARLAPLLESNSDRDILQHLAALAVAKDSKDLANLLMSVQLPDDVLLSLEPLAASGDRELRFEIARAIAQQLGAGTGGTQWLLAKAADQAAPELLRVASVKQLATVEQAPDLREAFLTLYSGNVPPLRVEALRALRRYELPRPLLEDATLDADADIQREAWQQMKSRFDTSPPVATKWRLYPNMRDEDIGMIIAGVTVVSTVITALTAIITSALAAAFWKSVALLVVGATASLASGGLVALLVIASQHSNAFADRDVQQMLYVVIGVLWLIIGISWFSAWRTYGQRPADARNPSSRRAT